MAMADFLHGSRQRPPPLRIAESLDAPMEKPTEAAVEGLCRVIASVIKSPKRPGDFHLVHDPFGVYLWYPCDH